jgi:O-antigen ligase
MPTDRPAGAAPLTHVVFWGLLLLVALAPFPLGSNRPVAWSALAVGAGLLLLLWGIGVLRRPGTITIRLDRTLPGLAVFGAVIAWTFLQASGWTPLEWHNGLWQEASVALSEPLIGAVSIDPEDTRTGAMRLLTFGAVFWLSLHLCRDTRRARILFWTLALAGLAYALYGLVIEFGQFKMILWFDRWAYRGSLTSTFVNRNSYAAYAGISLIVVTALLLPDLRRSLRLGFLNRTGFIHCTENAGFAVFFLLAAFVLIATALLLSRSRGGLLVAAIGLFVLVIALGLVQRRRGATTVGYGLGFLVLGYVLISLSGDATVARFADLATAGSGRAEVHALAVRAVGEHPLLGSGLDTFPEVFQMLRDDSFGPLVLPYKRAHSTYLEFALEAGLPAFAAMIVLLAGLAALCLRGVLTRKRDAAFPAAGLAATALIAVHSAVDFSLQIPGIAVTYFALLGAACAQSWPTSQRSGRPPRQEMAA